MKIFIFLSLIILINSLKIKNSNELINNKIKNEIKLLKNNRINSDLSNLKTDTIYEYNVTDDKNIFQFNVMENAETLLLKNINVKFEINDLRTDKTKELFIVFDQFYYAKTIDESSIINIDIILPDNCVFNMTDIDRFGGLSSKITNSLLNNVAIHFKKLKIYGNDENVRGLMSSYVNNSSIFGVYLIGEELDIEIVNNNNFNMGLLFGDVYNSKIKNCFVICDNIVINNYNNNLHGISGIAYNTYNDIFFKNNFVLIENIKSNYEGHLRFTGLINNYEGDLLIVEDSWSDLLFDYFKDTTTEITGMIYKASNVNIKNSYSNIHTTKQYQLSLDIPIVGFIHSCNENSLFSIYNSIYYIDNDYKKVYFVDFYDILYHYKSLKTYAYTSNDDYLSSQKVAVLVEYKKMIKDVSEYLNDFNSVKGSVYYQMMVYYDESIKDNNLIFERLNMKFSGKDIIKNNKYNLLYDSDLPSQPINDYLIEYYISFYPLSIFQEKYVIISSNNECIKEERIDILWQSGLSRNKYIVDVKNCPIKTEITLKMTTYNDNKIESEGELTFMSDYIPTTIPPTEPPKDVSDIMIIIIPVVSLSFVSLAILFSWLIYKRLPQKAENNAIKTYETNV